MKALDNDLKIHEIPTPTPSSHELLIKVHAAGVNRMDLLQRAGKYPIPPYFPKILGVEIAGVVDKVGSSVTKWKKGDRIMGLIDGGGYAEYAVIHEELAMPIPSNLSFTDAAAIPEVFLTAYQTIFFLGKYIIGGNVLIHAGAGGVGSAAIQIVKNAGGHAIATAGSDEKIAFCKQLGADAAFNYKKGPWQEDVLQATKKKGVDLILDFVGASFWEQNWHVLAQEGIIVLIGTMGGEVVEQVNLRDFLKKWATVTGTTLRTRSLEYKIRLVQCFLSFAFPLFEQGKLKPIVWQVVPWEKALEAHELMKKGANTGKIILSGL